MTCINYAKQFTCTWVHSDNDNEEKRIILKKENNELEHNIVMNSRIHNMLMVIHVHVTMYKPQPTCEKQTVCGQTV